ncbi:CsxC family protein [Clostridium sp.]|uniref:CsxC family protein n=1 Tax=Clostridium sp. TaxID=1506 RepID=UPI00260DF07B|nr:hypothetical protein [Clostridium sp.]
MEDIYHLRQNYNELRKKQYEEYVKGQNEYYIHMRKYYEEYVKNQNKYYLDKKRYYEEYIRRQNKYYLYIKRYYEEYVRNQNRYYLNRRRYYEEYIKGHNKYYLNKKKNNNIPRNKKKYHKNNISQNESFKNDSIEDKNINDYSMKNNIYYSLEINSEENNLEDKKGESAQNDNLENKNCISIEDLYNEELLGEKDEESLEEKDRELLSEDNEKFLGKKGEEFLEEENEEYFKENNEEFLKEDYNTVVKEELSEKNNISTECLYVKFPVVLAEANIIIPIEDTITLDQEASEIKEIKKNVLLTQSHLIPPSPSDLDPNSGILFIEGFIRKNIEYETKTCTTGGTENICGYTRHCTVEVPFKSTTRIDFIRSPIFIKKTITREIGFLKDSSQGDNIYVDSMIGNDPCEQGFAFTEIFNEKPFVELVKATFIEVDINKSPIFSREIPIKQKFTQITEKVIINLTLKVLQEQQIKVAIE